MFCVRLCCVTINGTFYIALQIGASDLSAMGVTIAAHRARILQVIKVSIRFDVQFTNFSGRWRPRSGRSHAGLHQSRRTQVANVGGDQKTGYSQKLAQKDGQDEDKNRGYQIDRILSKAAEELPSIGSGVPQSQIQSLPQHLSRKYRDCY